MRGVLRLVSGVIVLWYFDSVGLATEGVSGL